VPTIDYLDLLTECHEIRLLELHTAESGTLQYVPFDNAPKFLALSYNWGDPTPVAPFSVDNKKILLPQSLADALPRVFTAIKRQGSRDPWPKLIWADAICVNQRDPLEKAQQVAMMNFIYSKASTVVVDAAYSEGHEQNVDNWTVAIDNYFENLLLRNRLLHLVRNPHLVSMLSHRWWNRIWTLQEIALARDAALLIQNKSIDWLDIIRLSDLLQDVDRLALEYSHEFARVTIDTIHDGLATKSMLARLSDEYVKDKSWFFLLATTAQFESSDPRDRLYALVGLCQTLPGFEISYTRPTNEVFYDFTTLYLDASGSLELLQLCGVNLPNNWLLPSWVPNYENLNHRIMSSYIDRLQTKHFNRHIQNDLRVWDVCNGRRRKLHPSPDAATIIRPEGIQVDLISDICDLNGDWLSFAWNHLGGQYHPPTMKCHLLQAYFRTVLGDRDENTNSQLSISTDRYEIAGTFWNIIRKRHNRLIHQMHISTPIRDLLLDKSTEDISFTVQSHPNYTRISALMRRNEAQLHCFVTSQGYIGYGPTCKKDDVICVLFGCSVPLIMRRVEHGRWTIVGQCFVLGIMNGELCWNLVKKKDDPYIGVASAKDENLVQPPTEKDEKHVHPWKAEVTAQRSKATDGSPDDNEQQSGKGNDEDPLRREVEIFNIC
jgi:hypothetical protein